MLRLDTAVNVSFMSWSLFEILDSHSKRTCDALYSFQVFFSSSKAFCRCLLFQLSVREMLSTQSSFLRSRGRTVGNGNREADIVT